jgi:hypothetical protein
VPAPSATLVLAPAQEQFAVTITRAINSVLFIVVVPELVRATVAGQEGGGLPSAAVLVIAVISPTWKSRGEIPSRMCEPKLEHQARSEYKY